MIGHGKGSLLASEAFQFALLTFFFLLGHLKRVVYKTPIVSPEDAVSQISVAAADVHDVPGT